MNILITAGGTTEKIDQVRKIANTATGRLGSLIAVEFARRLDDDSHKIHYVCERGAVIPDLPCVETLHIQGVDALSDAVEGLLTKERIDVVVHSMAVADYAVSAVTTAGKLASSIAKKLMTRFANGLSNEDELSRVIAGYIRENEDVLDRNSKLGSDISDLMLSMRQTPKVIGLVKSLSPSTILVGFKLLDGVSREVLVDTAHALLLKNNCDFVLANDMKDIQSGEHIGFLVSPDRSYVKMNRKEEIAKGIVSAVLEKLKGGRRA